MSFVRKGYVEVLQKPPVGGERYDSQVMSKLSSCMSALAPPALYTSLAPSQSQHHQHLHPHLQPHPFSTCYTPLQAPSSPCPPHHLHSATPSLNPPRLAPICVGLPKPSTSSAALGTLSRYPLQSLSLPLLTRPYLLA